jgi:hypothetical protein
MLQAAVVRFRSRTANAPSREWEPMIDACDARVRRGERGLAATAKGRLFVAGFMISVSR